MWKKGLDIIHFVIYTESVLNKSYCEVVQSVNLHD